MHVAEDASNGSATGNQLMLLADDIAAGDTAQESGKAEAEALVKRETGT